MPFVKPKYIFAAVCLMGAIPAPAATSAVIAVVSSEISTDGPLLWQNLDSDRPQVAMRYFDDDRYHFIGLLNGGDSARVYAGLNTAGFALVLSPAADDDSLPDPAQFAKQALGRCGRLDDFLVLFADSTHRFRAGNSFACIDAYGGAAVIEANGTPFVAFNPFGASTGFVVRSNFNLSQANYADESYWRYHRARELFDEQKPLSAAKLLRTIARDLVGFEPPVVFEPEGAARRRDRPAHLRCRTGISNYRTVSSVVICGVRPGQNPASAMLWVILGEPICGAAVPLWPINGTVAKECRSPNPAIHRNIRDNERLVYDVKAPDLLNLRLLTDGKRGLLPHLLRLEAETFTRTERQRELGRNDRSLVEFQKKTAADVGRKIRL